MQGRRSAAIAQEARSITTRGRRCCTSRSASCRWSWTGSKKKLPSSVEVKRSWIEPNHPELSIRHQCELLQLNRATFQHQPWRFSTGPRTAAGKAKAALNGKHRQCGPVSLRQLRKDLAGIKHL